jgi:hypothetical protein
VRNVPSSYCRSVMHSAPSDSEVRPPNEVARALPDADVRQLRDFLELQRRARREAIAELYAFDPHLDQAAR